MDTNLIKLIEKFSSEDRCRTELERLRWPEGVRCLRCNSAKISRIKKRNQYDCDACRYQFSVTADTLLCDTHLPLWKWFLTAYLICESKKGISAHQIKRTIGVSYKTAWYLCHRIRAAMQEVEQEPLTGTVEVDETYIGGKPRRTWRGRIRSKKQAVLGIRQRDGQLRFFKIDAGTSNAVREVIADNVRNEVDVLITDESQIYPYALSKAHLEKHKTINHSREYVVGDVHTNTVESAFSLLKRGIVGTWHKVSVKHLPAYLNEVAFRFNNRKNPRLFQLTLRRLLTSKPLRFNDLTKAAA